MRSVQEFKRLHEDPKFDGSEPCYKFITSLVHNLSKRKVKADGKFSRQGRRWTDPTTRHIFEVIQEYGGPLAGGFLSLNVEGPTVRTIQRWSAKDRYQYQGRLDGGVFKFCAAVWSRAAQKAGFVTAPNAAGQQEPAQAPAENIHSAERPAVEEDPSMPDLTAPLTDDEDDSEEAAQPGQSNVPVHLTGASFAPVRIPVEICEDETAIEDRIDWMPKGDWGAGWCGEKGSNHQCDFSLRAVAGTAAEIESAFKTLKKMHDATGDACLTNDSGHSVQLPGEVTRGLLLGS